MRVVIVVTPMAVIRIVGLVDAVDRQRRKQRYLVADLIHALSADVFRQAESEQVSFQIPELKRFAFLLHRLFETSHFWRLLAAGYRTLLPDLLQAGLQLTYDRVPLSR